MACLVKCSLCNRDVSSETPSCPGCGHNIADELRQKQEQERRENQERLELEQHLEALQEMRSFHERVEEKRKDAQKNDRS